MSIFNTGGGASGGSNIDFSNGGEVVQVPVSSTPYEHNEGEFVLIEGLCKSFEQVSFSVGVGPYPGYWHIKDGYYLTASPTATSDSGGAYFRLAKINSDGSIEYGSDSSVKSAYNISAAYGYSSVVITSETNGYFVRSCNSSSCYVSKFTFDLNNILLSL